MKKLFWLCLALCLALPAAAQREYGLRFSSLINDELTLENAIRLGLENNSDFLAAQQEIIIAEQKVKEAKFLFLPQFSLQGTATWYDLDYPMVLPDSVANRFIPNNDLLSEDMKHQFLGAGISATQYLYAGGRFRNTLKMAEANLKQVQSKYEAVKNATVLNIKKSFFRLLYAQHNVELAEKVQQKAGRYSRSLHTGAWNKIKAQYLLSRLNSLKSEANNELQKAQLAMLVSLNKELNSQIKVRGDFKPVEVELDLPRLNLWAMEFRPELKAAIYALELDNLAIDLALSRRYPDLILTGSYERLGFDNLDDENKQISLAVRLPLPYNLSTQNAQRKAEQKQSTLRRAAIEDSIRVQVAENYADLVFWQAEVISRQQTWRDVQKLLSQAERAAAPDLTALEALDAYYQTGRSYYEAIRQNLTAKAGLEWAIGQDL
mgnify:FL=1